LVNRKIRSESISLGILSSFYNGARTPEIISGFSSQISSRQPRKDVCRNMRYLCSVGLLEKCSDKPPEYTITKKGRWYVIASKLGISLFTLILLANVYIFQKNMKKIHKPDFYVVGFFVEKIKALLTHTDRLHGTLIRKNYVIRYANQTIRIPDDVYKQLECKFDSDFEDISKWYQEIDDRIDLALIKK
jgi:hypothetical protein